MSNQLNPFSPEQQQLLSQLLDAATTDQLFWLSGYINGLSENKRESQPGKIAQLPATTHSGSVFTILYGTHTGHSEGIASTLAEKARQHGLNVKLQSLDDYKIRDLNKVENLALIVSTHGDGEPPLMAEAFYEYVKSGKVQLPNLNYSVLALGDRSYKRFCQTGIDFDEAFRALGGKEIIPIVKCDVDYEADALNWTNQLLSKLVVLVNASRVIPAVSVTNFDQPIYSKQNPFYATVLDKRKITGRHSDKEVWHVELSLENSGLSYEPGDAVGVFTTNPPELVQQIIDFTGYTPKTTITTKYDDVTLFEALYHYYEITVLNRNLLAEYAKITRNEHLNTLLQNEVKLDEYLYRYDLLDLLQDFPGKITAHQLVEILRYLPPRLYSIASSSAANPDEVHITISKVNFEYKSRKRKGACSTFISERLPANEKIPVFIEKNINFRLPQTDHAPVIMIGAGTGVAPYRAFLQEFEEKRRLNNSWLFFGERTFTDDFLYQVEWQKYLQKGVLGKIDLAFSRDQSKKIYVQHKLQENASELYKWIEHGAHLYVCGDRKKMFSNVQDTLLNIIKTEGEISEEKAAEYLHQLKREKRYQTDVY